MAENNDNKNIDKAEKMVGVFLGVARQQVGIYFQTPTNIARPFEVCKLELVPDKEANTKIRKGCQGIALEYAQKYKDNKDFVVDFFVEKETRKPGIWMSQIGMEFDESKLPKG